MDRTDSACAATDGELVCALRRGHRTDYHEDVEGHRWPVSPAPSAGTPPVGETALDEALGQVRGWLRFYETAEYTTATAIKVRDEARAACQTVITVLEDYARLRARVAALATVWFVEAGSYSDYRVVGVFSTEAKAQRVAAMLSGADASVREVVIDPGGDKLREGLSLFWLHITEDGSIGEDYRTEYLSESHMTAGDYWCLRSNYGDGLSLIGRFWAKSREHANHIMADRRRAMVSAGEWRVPVGDRYRLLEGAE